MELFSYHNTTSIDEETRLSFEEKAKNQDQEIWKFLVKYDEKVTASEVYEYFSNFTDWPITSIRRSLSNLCKRGLLVKLKDTKISPLGRPEHYHQRIPLV